MKLINAFYLALVLLFGAASWKFLEPIIAQNGSSVISSMSSDNQNGSKPISIKLPDTLTKKQFEMLNFAYDVAKLDGFKEPKYLQGIIMQESKAGSMNSFRVAGLTNAVGDRYFGIGQIKLVAAKFVMTKFPDMWKFLDTKTDEELQARLIVDDQFNVRVASKYALLMGINDNPTRALTAYNVGPGGVKDVNPSQHAYTQKVKAHAENAKNIKVATIGLQLGKSIQVASLGPHK